MPRNAFHNQNISQQRSLPSEIIAEILQLAVESTSEVKERNEMVARLIRCSKTFYMAAVELWDEHLEAFGCYSLEGERLRNGSLLRFLRHEIKLSMAQCPINTRLRVLHFSESGIEGDKVMSSLDTVLSHCPMLEELSLSKIKGDVMYLISRAPGESVEVF